MSFIYNMVDTWNDAGTTFTGLKLNVTDTASAAASLLMDLQVGGVSKLKVTKSAVTIVGDAMGNGGLQITTSGGLEPFLTRNSVDGGLILGQTSGAPSIWIGQPDLAITRDAANVLAQRNGTAAQAFRLSNTHTDPSNYERGGFDWQATANTLRIRSEAAGTGTVRIIAIDGFSKAGAAVAGDIPAGTWALVRDTVGATTKLIYNNAGTLMSVALA